MIFFGSGTVALIVLAVWSFFKVDLGPEGPIMGCILVAFALATFYFFCAKTVQFVRGGNILAWLI